MIICNRNVDKRNIIWYLKIYFHNKGVDMVNLPSILHHKMVIATIPSCIKNPSPPVVSYKYPKTIASKVFNFKKQLLLIWT